MRVPALCGFNQFVYNVLWRRLVWVSHTEINNVLTRGPRFLLEFACDVENVGGESIDTGKMVVHNGSK
jgi:hypothetical protein